MSRLILAIISVKGVDVKAMGGSRIMVRGGILEGINIVRLGQGIGDPWRRIIGKA